MDRHDARRKPPAVEEPATSPPRQGEDRILRHPPGERGRLIQAYAASDAASRARLVHALQRSAGNCAVARALEGSKPAKASRAQLQRQTEMVPVVVGGANLGIGAYLAAGGTVAGGTSLAPGTAVVATTVLAEGAAAVGTTAVAGGATVVAVPATATAAATATATATGGVAAAGTTATASATVPVIGWVVAGLIVSGIVVYLVYRATRDEPSTGVQAPPAHQGPPVTEPSSGPPVSLPPAVPRSSPGVIEPGPGVPASLPSDQPPVPVLASGSPDDVPGNLERLERLERSGDFFGDAEALRAELRSGDAATRAAAERRLRDYERAAADYRSQQQPSAERADEAGAVERAIDPRVRTIAEPGGDAWEYHRAEFLGFGVRTPEELAEFLDRIVSAPDARKVDGDREAYWDQESGTIVILNPSQPHGGTAFRPGGRSYFDRWPRVGPPRRR